MFTCSQQPIIKFTTQNIQRLTNRVSPDSNSQHTHTHSPTHSRRLLIYWTCFEFLFTAVENFLLYCFVINASLHTWVLLTKTLILTTACDIQYRYHFAFPWILSIFDLASGSCFGFCFSINKNSLISCFYSISESFVGQLISKNLLNQEERSNPDKVVESYTSITPGIVAWVWFQSIRPWSSIMPTMLFIWYCLILIWCCDKLFCYWVCFNDALWHVATLFWYSNILEVYLSQMYSNMHMIHKILSFFH